MACSENLLDIVILLHEHGARFDQPDRWGRTPIDEAKMSGHVNLVSPAPDRRPRPQARGCRIAASCTAPQQGAICPVDALLC